jgi:hydrogenase maturation protein HypF
VLEGDVQGSLDADRLSVLHIPVVQLNTDGGFGGECHLDANMVRSAIPSLPLAEIDLLIVENVGNLVCPAEFRIGEDARIMVCSVTEGEDKPLKYPLMFRACELVIINRSTCSPTSTSTSSRLRRTSAPCIRGRADARSARTGEGVERGARLARPGGHRPSGSRRVTAHAPTVLPGLDDFAPRGSSPASATSPRRPTGSRGSATRAAERFARGGRLIALGRSPAARSDARHVAVEFVHPVIVGKRALPALALDRRGRPSAGAGRAGGRARRHADRVRARAIPETAEASAALTRCGCLRDRTSRPTRATRSCARSSPRRLPRPLGARARLLRAPRAARGPRAETVHDSGASRFLYPFLGEQEHDLEAVVADVRASVLTKAAETAALRVQTLIGNADVLRAAAADLRAAYAAGGRLLALGNGGSATDAMDVVADFHAPLGDGPARAAIDLTEDTGILTALANDIGPDAIFARQVIAHARPGDVLLALSTSGTSGSVIAALEEGAGAACARSRWLATTAGAWLPRRSPITSWSAARSTSRASRRRRPAHTTRCACWWRSHERAPPPLTRRIRARVQGTVQGVGFRPYVYRLARDERLAGWVRNDELGVLLEVEGAAAAIERFLERLPREAPPLATVEHVRSQALASLGEREFAIVASTGGGPAAAPFTPDSAPCEACVSELRDPRDRRFRYPFINCTDCGPRFTIVRGVPYDRARTTMAGFVLCEGLPRGVRRPARPPASTPSRTPARSVARACGCSTATASPSLSTGAPDAVAEAARALLAGLIVAVKGAGGYHLACSAGDAAAVSALRARKHREDKPFALMVADLEAARALVVLSRDEERLLCGRERPIVIASRRRDAAVAAAVAPGNPELGVMLPSTPLHELLLADAGTTLVMTSGNVSDEPIAFDDAEALERLAPIADRFLTHDRPIETRADDSVLRGPLLLRRSRGLVPASIGLPAARAPLLACGAELKSTFCLAKDGRAWVGHHIGDLRNWETLRSYRIGVAHFERLFAVAPEVVAHELTRLPLDRLRARARRRRAGRGAAPTTRTSRPVLAEHGEAGPAVGAIYDGAGLGSDGAVWGGELLVGGVAGCERAGTSGPVRLPGGDAAVRSRGGWRAPGCTRSERRSGRPGGADGARAARALGGGRRAGAQRHRGAGDEQRREGLFDAVAALCGIRAEVNYEGQAAAELEAACDPRERGAYPLPVIDATRSCWMRVRRSRRSSRTWRAAPSRAQSRPASTPRLPAPPRGRASSPPAAPVST